MKKVTYSEAEVVDLLREDCRKAGSLNKWARAHSISPPYVSDVLLGRRRPGPKILAVFGLERSVKVVEMTYRHVA